MNELEDSITEQPLVTDDPKTEPEPKVKPVKKQKKIGYTLIVFLLGALTYAAVVGLYNFMHMETAKQDDRTSSLSSQQAAQSQVAGPATETPAPITDQELEKFVDPVDCTQEPAYANVKISRSLSEIMTIDLYDGMLLRGGSNTGQVKWKTLPVVVDYSCKTIKITDLNIKDRVNTYVLSSPTSAEAAMDVKLIQKANN